MAFDDISILSDKIKQWEGLRLKAYLDTVGVLSIGYGHNCISSPVPGVHKVGDSITQDLADELFEKDLASSIWATRHALPWVTSLNNPRQAVLYDMAFNMGVGTTGGAHGLLSFRNTLKYIENGDYAAAAAAMRKSKWATQVGRRARQDAAQMETGEWQ